MMIIDDESYPALPLPTYNNFTIHAIPDLPKFFVYILTTQAGLDANVVT